MMREIVYEYAKKMGYLAQIRELKLILMYAVVSGHLLARVM